MELAYGIALGRDGSAPELPPVELAPRAALEAVLLRALERPPCLVSFSGGRDSSALLALAVHVARRHGLDDPVPATLVFPAADAADESSWQRLILDGLALKRWERLRFTDELDAVGPVARTVLSRHGLIWPFNVHMHLPIIELAAGGSVVTGFYGDELARASETLYAENLVAARKLRRPRDAALIAYRRSPAAVKRVRELSRSSAYLGETPWLTARGRLELRLALAADYALPFGWGRLVRERLWPGRYLQLCRAGFDRVAEPDDVRCEHPFADPLVLASLADHAPLAGLGRRSTLIERLFGDLLPPGLAGRTTKASFSDPLLTETTMSFARAWSGRGLPERLVEPEAVRSAWLHRRASATTLLQTAWLHDLGLPSSAA